MGLWKQRQNGGYFDVEVHKSGSNVSSGSEIRSVCQMRVIDVLSKMEMVI